MTENLNKKPPKGILKTSSSFDTASCGSTTSPQAGGRRNSGIATNIVGGSGGGGGDNSAAAAAANVGSNSSSRNELTVVDDEGGGGGGGGGIGPDGYMHVRKHSKTAKFDEMNILETYHPATKTYGHMKIEEPKTPFNYYEDDDEVEAEAAGSSSSSSSQKRRSKEINPDELLKRLNENLEKRGGSVEEEEGEDEGSSEEEDEDLDPETKAARMKFESKRKAHYNEYYAVKLARKLMEQDEDEDDEGGGGGGGGSGAMEQKFIPEEEVAQQLDRDNNVEDERIDE